MAKTTFRPVSLAHFDGATLWSVLSAIFLGAFLIIGAGFAHPNVVHNAAHDTRHSLSFPCH